VQHTILVRSAFCNHPCFSSFVGQVRNLCGHSRPREDRTCKSPVGACYSLCQEETYYAACTVVLRTARDNITALMPLMTMLTPTSVPIAQAELDGQWI
jgi:hypothetical protein